MAAFLMAGSLRTAQTSDEEEWRPLLKKAAEYCRRLERSALDFICLEEISEKLDLSRDVSLDMAKPRGGSGDKVVRRGQEIPRGSITNAYVYDYQLVRKAGRARESRILLEENGEKKSVKDAPLKTLSFVYRNILFGPLGVLSEAAQALHDFTPAGEEVLDGRRVFIIEARPKSGLRTEYLFGKVWIREGDGAILKILWNPEGVGRQELFKDRADRYGSQVRLTMVSDLSVEKNGIRFPSRFWIEEAYLVPGGEKFIRSETTVVYRNFRFFTVDVDVSF